MLSGLVTIAHVSDNIGNPRDWTIRIIGLSSREGVVSNVKGESVYAISLSCGYITLPVVDGKGGGKSHDVVGDNDLGDVCAGDLGGGGANEGGGGEETGGVESSAEEHG